MKKTAITGATGFVGKRLVKYNQHIFEQQILDLRNNKVGNIDLHEIDAVIHLAGKAHEMNLIPDNVYFDVNYELTRQLADKAKAQGVLQFVYISSVKVYGNEVPEILDEQSACIPTDAYGSSKLKAEQYLQSIQTDTFQVAIVRPPLVYGPGVKGNMIRLMQLADKNIPLPFGNIKNARSMVFVDNLIALINKIVEQKAAGVFIAGDAAPISTSQLLWYIKSGLGRKPHLLSVPLIVRKVLMKVRPALYLRLFGSFVVDNRITNDKLDFIPPYSTQFGIEQMAKWFKISIK
ncbi:MAG: NAD-dependent epimerase/dehydratase family protein [Ferruginibacter sp.]